MSLCFPPISNKFLQKLLFFFFEFFSFFSFFFLNLEHPKQQLRKRISKIKKNENSIVILTHTHTKYKYIYIYIYTNVCCYSTNRVRRRPQGHQGSGVYLLLLVLSFFFLFNTTDLIIGVFFSQRRRAFDDDAIFLLPYLILQKRIDVCDDDARERDLISDAARCWSHRENERKRTRVTLLLKSLRCAFVGGGSATHRFLRSH